MYDWRFEKKHGEEGLYCDNDIDNLTEEAYFDIFKKSKLTFDLSEASQLILDINAKENTFQEIMELGRELKAGEFNKDDFIEHLAFLIQC